MRGLAIAQSLFPLTNGATLYDCGAWTDIGMLDCDGRALAKSTPESKRLRVEGLGFRVKASDCL